MKSEILILGSTGSVGYAFAENLIAKNIAITVLVRDVAKANNLFKSNPIVEIIRGDDIDKVSPRLFQRWDSASLHTPKFPRRLY